MSSMIEIEHWLETGQMLVVGCNSIIKIWDALHDLVPFVQFKKREKHSWSSVNFSKVAAWSLQLY